MYILDSNIASEFRRPRTHPAVVAWFAQTALEVALLNPFGS